MQKIKNIWMVVACLCGALLIVYPSLAANNPFEAAWPHTDFSKTNIDMDEILRGGPPKDGIRSIENPNFIPQAENKALSAREPVIMVSIKGDKRAYPVQILIYHEIVNDVVGGVPIAVTYCPLCNSAIVFDRRLDGEILEFGTTGLLRNSDLVMYDRSSESWWQQYTGKAIVGDKTDKVLTMISSQMVPVSHLASRFPDAKLMINDGRYRRAYGNNPYVGYDDSAFPFLYNGVFDAAKEGVSPMERVVAIGGEAWAFNLLIQEKRIEKDGLVIEWQSGQASALDQYEIAKGRDVGTVFVHQQLENGDKKAVIYDTPFAFAFRAFNPDGILHHQ